MMGDDPGILAALGLGTMQAPAAQYAKLAYMPLRANPPPNKLDQAIAFLRARGRYCLDVKQARIPPEETHKPTCLDVWRAQQRREK